MVFGDCYRLIEQGYGGRHSSYGSISLDAYTIAPLFLGTIKRLISGLYDLFWSFAIGRTLSKPYADRHRQRLMFWIIFTSIYPGLFIR